jgi:hypothetical protein
MTDSTSIGGDFDGSPNVKRLIDLLQDGPLPAPPLRVVQRVKGMASPPVAPLHELARSVKEFVAELIYDSRATPALAGFRGAVGATHLTYTCEAGEVDIQISRANAGRQGLTRLIGQIETLHTPRLARLRSGQGRDAGDGGDGASGGGWRTVAETSIDRTGIFTFDAAPGRYDLTISLDQSAITIPSLEL